MFYEQQHFGSSFNFVISISLPNLIFFMLSENKMRLEGHSDAVS
jgi:hypothetical protein